MSVPAHTQTGPNFRRQGAIILSGFALIWATAGASGLDDGTIFWGIAATALAVTIGSIMVAVRAASTRTAPRHLAFDWQRRYNLVGLAQAVAIAASIFALVTLDLPGLIPPVVCIIVGIHFIPLAPTFDQAQYRWTAIALCVVGAIGTAMYGLASDETVRAVVGLAAAVVLWATAAIVVRSG